MSGGLYGINVEVLTGDKTLVPGVDPIYQYLDPVDVDRVISLDTANAVAGDRFFIMHHGAWDDINCLDIVQDGGLSRDRAYVFARKEFIFNGSDWVGVMTGTGRESDMAGIAIGCLAQAKECGVAVGPYVNAVLDAVAVGYGADAHNYGTAMGRGALAYESGVAVGWNSDGNTGGIAVGYGAVGYSYGTALGYLCDTNSKRHSIALGYQSRNTRDAELAINIGDEVADDLQYQYQQIIIGSWVRKTANDTPVVMRVDGADAGRFTIRRQSALTFKIMVTAKDDATGDCAVYIFNGLIKRDDVNTTLHVYKTVEHEDDANWDCDIAADDANEALQITVTGDAANLVRWAARLDGVETSFTPPLTGKGTIVIHAKLAG